MVGRTIVPMYQNYDDVRSPKSVSDPRSIARKKGSISRSIYTVLAAVWVRGEPHKAYGYTYPRPKSGENKDLKMY